MFHTISLISCLEADFTLTLESVAAKSTASDGAFIESIKAIWPCINVSVYQPWIHYQNESSKYTFWLKAKAIFSKENDAGTCKRLNYRYFPSNAGRYVQALSFLVANLTSTQGKSGYLEDKKGLFIWQQQDKDKALEMDDTHRPQWALAAGKKPPPWPYLSESRCCTSSDRKTHGAGHMV